MVARRGRAPLAVWRFRRLLAQFLLREGEQRAVSQPAAITLPSLSRRDDVLGQNFPSGQSIILGGEWCLAGLNTCPRTVEGGSQNLYFLGVKDPVGEPLNKSVHWGSPRPRGRNYSV